MKFNVNLSFPLVYLFFSTISSLTAQVKVDILPEEPYIVDSQHYSHVFGDIRKFRIFLPPEYYRKPDKNYPVIYFFHGWAERYFGSMGDGYANYDHGDVNAGDNIANFVASHDVIVVKMDGLDQFPGEALNLTPYNIGTVESFRQFPIYFPEFVDFIDNNYRTIADREHRAVSGLSMGGFMTFWVSGKYPHLVSAAGNFCGSPEFFVGPRAFPVEYNHLYMYDNYAGLNVRLNYGTRDKLRYYHTDLNRVWPDLLDNYEYKIYEASHVTCGLGEMFGFIYKTFENPPPKPEKWDHIDVYPAFSVWDYQITSDRQRPGFTVLENVDARGFKSAVKTFLRDGELMPYVNISLQTAPIYEKNQLYIVNDIDAKTLKASQDSIWSDGMGRVKLNMDGGIHHIGINRARDLPNISFISYEVKNMPWATTQKDVTLSIKLLNKGLSDAEGLTLELSSTRNYVEVKENKSKIDKIPVNQIQECAESFVFHVPIDSIEISRFKLTIRDKDNNEWIEYFEVPLREELPLIEDYTIADGKIFTVVNAAVDSAALFLGEGNGDGVANPGESIVILVKDGGKYYRANLYASDPLINPNGVSIRMSDSWASYDYIGGSAKYTIPVISSDCPDGHSIDFFADYWVPHQIDHIIKKGGIKVNVRGTDITPPVMQWMEVTADNIIQARIYDGTAIQQVKARLIPDPKAPKYKYVDWEAPEKGFVVELTDTGQNGDKRAGDFVFTGAIYGQPSYFYKVTIEMTDALGNKKTEDYPDPIFLKNTQ